MNREKYSVVRASTSTEPKPSRLATYTVHVRETRVFWETLHVDAATEEEAKQVALEEFQVDWSDSEELETEVAIVAKEGKS